MSILRDLVALVAAVLAVAAMLAFLVGNWVSAHVVSESGFLAITEPLAHDVPLQEQFAQSALDSVAPGLPVPEGLRTEVESTLVSQVHLVAESGTYGEIWSGSMADLHGELVRGDAQASIRADIAPVWNTLAEPINSLLPFGLEIPVPESTILTLATFDASWFTHAVTLAESAPIFGVVGIAAALAALVLARHRLVALWFLGLTLALGSGALWLALDRHEVLMDANNLGDIPFLSPILRVFLEAARSDLSSVTLIFAGAGVAMVVIAAIAAIVVRVVQAGERPGR
ncbi:MAG: hypothetical protein Q4G21_11485 [Dermabacter sp.]|nr:hypothetical protein [Dermabacter sp.]